MLFSLTACRQDRAPEADGTAVTSQQGVQKQSGISEAATSPDGIKMSDDTTLPEETTFLTENLDGSLLEGDSYWVLEKAVGDMRSTELPENIWTDLTLWADGTARIREIEDGIWLYGNKEEWNLTWKCEADGTLQLYNGYSSDILYSSGRVTEKSIEISRFDGTFCFRREPMPEGGALYSPTELRGVWLQVSRKTEKDEEVTMPDTFNSLVFRQDWAGGNQMEMFVSSESGDYSGFGADGRYYERKVTILEQPISSDCSNMVWSARIGDESLRNEYGNPQGMETYVTLLNQNTLLEKHCFSKDEGRSEGVSYQLYKRFLPAASYDFERANLEGRCFELAGYTDAGGRRLPAPPGMSDFTLCLNEIGYHFTVTFDDGSSHKGTGPYWTLGEGGTILMSNADFLQECYAGATQSINGIPELYIWYEGGIMCLKYIEDSSGDMGNASD